MNPERCLVSPASTLLPSGSLRQKPEQGVQVVLLRLLSQVSVSGVSNGSGTSHCRTSYRAETELTCAQSKLLRETSEVSAEQFVPGLAGMD